MTHVCQRCQRVVYHAEKVGPVNGVVFHRQCFLCSVCRQHLTVRSYFTNQADAGDKEIYCSGHCPRPALHGYDANALFLKSGMRTPSRKNDMGHTHQIRSGSGVPHIQFDALHISEPVQAQSRFAARQQPEFNRYQYPAYLVSRTKEKLFGMQQDLETVQRAEEDRLMETFHRVRVQETQVIEREMEEEWEKELRVLTEKYTNSRKSNKRDKSTLTSEGYEREKEELKKTLTVKMEKKREIMTVRLEREQQEQTTELIQKHSQQMIYLIHSKQEELKQELKQEIAQEMLAAPGAEDQDGDALLEEALAALMLPTELPDPHPPRCRKRDFYHDPAVFDLLDQEVMKVAETDHATFTELVKHLTTNCVTDLQKARAIFRWITLKDLNVMRFDETARDNDTPLGLLRGIKYGTETYHALYLRLCSYAGLPCTVIKGHSKSVGYLPGMKIRDDTFQNSWNAVLINGDWWPVQCNWAARHLVLNKDSSKSSASGRAEAKKRPARDKIKYQYDEHYFLTDPDEFIHEFLADDQEWQLLEKPISREEFEDLPFVRSIFFQYGLEFERGMKAVIVADESGGTEVKVKVPQELSRDLVFHYQLRFAEKERMTETEFNGAKLERFVFQTVTSTGSVSFSVHVPTIGAYYLEIFTNRIDDSNRLGDDPSMAISPFRLKCSCKFKIVCAELRSSMLSLPDCASGEWGPWKAHRHIGLDPLTHRGGVISTDGKPTEVKFKIPRSLLFQCKLRSSNLQDSKALLEQFVGCRISGNELIITLTIDKPGQYGLDIYAKPENSPGNVSYAHACKYLVNCVSTQEMNAILSKNPNISPTHADNNEPNSSHRINRERIKSQHADVQLGPTGDYEKFSIQIVRPLEFCVDRCDLKAITVEINRSGTVRLSGNLICQVKYNPSGNITQVSDSREQENGNSKVIVKDTEKKTILTVQPQTWGIYLFQVLALKSPDTMSRVVFNYIFSFNPPGTSKDARKE